MQEKWADWTLKLTSSTLASLKNNSRGRSYMVMSQRHHKSWSLVNWRQLRWLIHLTVQCLQHRECQDQIVVCTTTMMTCPLISSMRRICSDREPPRAPTLNRVTISCCKWLIRAVIDMLGRGMRMMIKGKRKGSSPSHLNHLSSSARQGPDAPQPYCQTTLLSTLVCLNFSSRSLESSKNPNRLHLKGQFAPTMRPNTEVPDQAVTQAEIAIEATSMA